MKAVHERKKTFTQNFVNNSGSISMMVWKIVLIFTMGFIAPKKNQLNIGCVIILQPSLDIYTHKIRTYMNYERAALSLRKN